VKTLIVFILLVWSAGLVAGDALFTWGKPVPQFGGPGQVPEGWIIDGYRVKCTVQETGGQWSAEIAGYDTEEYQATGLVVGTHVCHMVSFSNGYGGESLPSMEVSKQIFAEDAPDRPINFDFNQSFRAIITPIPD